ncbi:MAG: hypothetical protein KDB90_11635 [Planctomycetes bacterium]|nr:hypothetical protein [Planctomycetota bacterium]
MKTHVLFEVVLFGLGLIGFFVFPSLGWDVASDFQLMHGVHKYSVLGFVMVAIVITAGFLAFTIGFFVREFLLPAKPEGTPEK